MASSEDEGETVPHSVSNYHFVNDKNEPISFSELPVRWNDGEGLDGKRKQIFLHGDADKGLQKIHKQVMAWTFDLSDDEKPLVLVLSKENKWIKLQKPRKSFEETIRTILITVHCLHSVKKNPSLSGKSLWDHLYKVYRSYEIRPSENDLIDHASIISEAVEKDETLAQSKFLVTFLKEKPQKKKALDEEIGTATNFIVDDDMIDEFEESDGSDEEDDLFDSVCAICDNGGDILCCEGRCMRSFHATVEAGADSSCESLGLTNEHVDAIQNFLCKNCLYKRHQCFFCGELGSSDKSSGAEVFPCVSATCGRFYHPHCAAKLLHREIAAEREELQKKIADGESFTCPIHKCSVCKQGENKMDPDLQFAVCRRCPTSYHRKCLPKKIAFEDVVSKGIIQRAWEGLIPNRILIYCLKHELDDELRTPPRNHIQFPDDGQRNKKQVSEKLKKREEVVQKKRKLDSADACRRSSLEKIQKGVDLSSIKAEDGPKKSVRRSTLPDPSKKRKVGDASVKPLNRSGSIKVTKFTDENRVSLGDQLYNNFFSKGSASANSRKEDTPPDSQPKQTLTDKPVAKDKGVSLSLDDASKQRILALVKDAGSSITLEKIIERHKMPTTFGYSSRNAVDKSLTLGKVEVSVEAICAALKELEKGCSVEDAKTVCEPGLLNQIIKWKTKLGGYLAPFLNGARYTSLGRHFTKVDKLKEIVDLLHFYVQDGDMMVDFCCGSNDFSLLMKEKLDKIGTRCSYKNYDLVQAKNNFNFEKRDWMTVSPNELPTGSKLIMGLNPPFGKNARDANKFIDKALEFKPKLLILIAPPETERLDKKNPPYDLIWEDNEMLAGKSFYLPGSVDMNNNQLDDWNLTTSLLNLWSRPDWTAKHKAIAQRHGHLTRLQEQTHSETRQEMLVSDKAMEAPDLNGEIPMSSDGHPVQNDVREASVLESHKDGSPSDNKKREVRERSKSSHGKNCSKEDPKKMQCDEAKPGRESSVTSPAFKERGPSQDKERGPGPRSKMHDKHPRLSQPREVSEHSNSSLRKNRSDEDSKKRLPDKGKRGRESSEKSPSSKERGLNQERGQSPRSKSYDKHPRLSPPREVRQHSNSSPGKNRSDKDLKKRQPDRGNRRRESDETSSAFKERGPSQEKGQSPLSEMYDKLPRLSPPIVSSGRSLEDGNFSEPPELGHYLTRYGENRVDEIDRVYSLGREEHVPGGGRVWPSGASPSRGLDYGHILDYGVRNPAVTEEHVLGGTCRWPSGASHGHGLHYGRSLDYGVGNLAEQFPGYQRETMDNGGHRSYVSELGQNYPSDTAIRSDGRLYGQQQQYHDSLGGQRGGGYLGIGDPGLPSPYGPLNPAPGSSYKRMSSTSAMARYLPQLDEMNHTRVNPLAAVPPHHTAGRNGIPDPHAPTAGYRVDSMGFAPGPYRPYPEHNSSGWLN